MNTLAQTIVASENIGTYSLAGKEKCLHNTDFILVENFAGVIFFFSKSPVCYFAL